MSALVAPPVAVHSRTRLVAIGLLGGAFSGLLGVGGGIVMVPALVLFLGLSQRDAHATSLAAIIPISAVSVVAFGFAGEVDYLAAVLLTIGAVSGARVGTDALARIDELRLQAVFGMFLVGAAVLMVVVR